MKRRAVSEIVSAIIVIVVVVAGLGIYTGLSQQRILGDTMSVKETILQQEDQISEMLQFVTMHKTGSDTVGVFVHNFGMKNITISKMYVNGTTDMSSNPNSFHVRSLNEILVAPNNKTIPLGKTSEIVLDFGGVTVTEGISNLVIKTDSDKIIQIQNDTN